MITSYRDASPLSSSQKIPSTDASSLAGVRKRAPSSTSMAGVTVALAALRRHQEGFFDNRGQGVVSFPCFRVDLEHGSMEDALGR